ncbi:hypothetical protein DPX16_1446 [Anabarilius grahami]|uniref:Uncharacterized protein n=1 Tax=Anabarilius grahami TaxID=495550 RepID=A0A3N0YKW2_ANAGA|nr:hypothetical protein DPX16_1446 [Anabarilius grahami]
MLSAQDTSYTALGVKANAARGQSKDERFTLRLFPLGSAARQTPRKRIGARTGGREEREEICTSHPVCICLSVSLSLARRLNNRQEESRGDIQSHLSERLIRERARSSEDPAGDLQTRRTSDNGTKRRQKPAADSRMDSWREAHKRLAFNRRFSRPSNITSSIYFRRLKSDAFDEQNLLWFVLNERMKMFDLCFVLLMLPEQRNAREVDDERFGLL